MMPINPKHDERRKRPRGSKVWAVSPAIVMRKHLKGLIGEELRDFEVHIKDGPEVKDRPEIKDRPKIRPFIIIRLRGKRKPWTGRTSMT